MEWPKDLQIHETQDGSPTLVFKRDGYCEKMHHAHGALSESLFIYKPAVEMALARQQGETRVFSLGLGLGYNEMIVAALTRQRGLHNITLISSESLTFLSNHFQTWLEQRPGGPLDGILNRVCELIACRFDIPANEIRSTLAEMQNQGRFELRGAFPGQVIPDVREVHCILFDAYSKKMDPELWNENSLILWLQSLAAERCVLATYAATGVLNRALKQNKFHVTKQKGFSGKRESTLALRG